MLERTNHLARSNIQYFKEYLPGLKEQDIYTDTESSEGQNYT